MKLHNDSESALNTVTAYGEGYIEVNQVRFSHAIAFGPEGDVAAWPVHEAAAITPALLRQAAGLPEPSSDPLSFLDDPEQAPAPRLPPGAPEILLVGTGRRQHFLPPALLGPLLAAGIGVETMDTQAASRTYNILMAEGRRVVAALIPSGDPQP